DGAIIEEPCVNRSGALTVIYGVTVYLGFGLVKSIEHNSIIALLEARQQGGPFLDIQDFVKRVSVSLEQLILFIRCNAFRFLGATKKQLLWEAHLLLGKAKKSDAKPSLFSPELREFQLPPLFTAHHEDAFDQMELFGFPLSDPFALIETFPSIEIMSKELPNYLGKQVTVVGYLVTIKPTKTSNGKAMYFGTFIDRQGEWLDSVHFPPVAEKYPFRGRGVYAITGTVAEEFECYSIEASSMEKLPMIPDPRYSEARTVTQIRNQQGLMKQKKRLRG
ncbi:MAG: DNA polymerase III subunit alpha, partial [Bacteroidota bacterium]